MRLLLDTHALVWWWTDDPRLPLAAREAIASETNPVCVSAASAWEIATKHRLGRWPDAGRIVAAFDALLRRSRFLELPISLEHGRVAGGLQGEHRDPFDRMLIAQSKLEALTLVTRDPVFSQHGVSILWNRAPAEKG